MARTHSQYQAFLRKADDATHAVLVTDLKRFSAMIAICKASVKSGVESHAFYYAYKCQAEYLALAPSAPSPFPLWMKKKVHGSAADIAPASKFWTVVSSAAMMEAGFTADEIPRMQQSFVADKIVSAVSMSSLDEAKATLVTVCATEVEISSACASDETKAAVSHTRVIAALPSEPLAKAHDDLVAALAAVEAGSDMLTGFANYPHGRSMVSLASNKQKELGKRLSELARLKSTVARFTILDLTNHLQMIQYFTMLKELGDHFFKSVPFSSFRSLPGACRPWPVCFRHCDIVSYAFGASHPPAFVGFGFDCRGKSRFDSGFRGSHTRASGNVWDM